MFQRRLIQSKRPLTVIVEYFWYYKSSDAKREWSRATSCAMFLQSICWCFATLVAQILDQLPLRVHFSSVSVACPESSPDLASLDTKNTKTTTLESVTLATVMNGLSLGVAVLPYSHPTACDLLLSFANILCMFYSDSE